MKSRGNAFEKQPWLSPVFKRQLIFMVVLLVLLLGMSYRLVMQLVSQRSDSPQGGAALEKTLPSSSLGVETDEEDALTPLDPIINDHLGDVYWAVGRDREAEFQWRRALSFDPEEEEADRIRRKLEVGLDAVLEEEGKAPINLSGENSHANGFGAAGTDKMRLGGDAPYVRYAEMNSLNILYGHRIWF